LKNATKIKRREKSKKEKRRLRQISELWQESHTKSGKRGSRKKPNY